MLRAGMVVPGPLMRELQRANALEAQGQFADAAPLFAQLSELAAQRQMPARAANLSLRAARAYLEIRDVAHALPYAQRGLQALADLGNWERVQRAGARIVQALRAQGHKADADALQKQITEMMASAGLTFDPNATAAPSAAEQPRGSVPAKCPQCAGPLRSDEVEWIDNDTVECPYCGSAVKTV